MLPYRERPACDPRCELHCRFPGGEADHRPCSRLIGREPLQHWQALDLQCAVCLRSPCETPDACTAAILGEG